MFLNKGCQKLARGESCGTHRTGSAGSLAGPSPTYCTWYSVMYHASTFAMLQKIHLGHQCRPSPSLSSVFLTCYKLKKSCSKTLWTISQRKLNLEKQKVQRLEVHVDL